MPTSLGVHSLRRAVVFFVHPSGWKARAYLALNPLACAAVLGAMFDAELLCWAMRDVGKFFVVG